LFEIRKWKIVFLTYWATASLPGLLTKLARPSSSSLVSTCPCHVLAAAGTGRPVDPTSARLAVFKPQELCFPLCLLHSFSHAAVSPPRTERCSSHPRHRYLRRQKLAAGGPPPSSITRTSLRLNLRHIVLALISPSEIGRVALSGFAAVGHGAAALDLTVGRVSPLLFSPLELPCCVRLPLTDPMRTPSCPVMAGNGCRPAAHAAMAPWSSA
jgi:hypothetical protein